MLFPVQKRTNRKLRRDLGKIPVVKKEHMFYNKDAMWTDRREADREVTGMEEELLKTVRSCADPTAALLLAIDILRLSLAAFGKEKETPG